MVYDVVVYLSLMYVRCYKHGQDLSIECGLSVDLFYMVYDNVVDLSIDVMFIAINLDRIFGAEVPARADPPGGWGCPL